MQHFGGLVDAQAAEEAQLDHLRFARCQLRQRVQRIVEGHEIIGAIGAMTAVVVERDMLGAAPRFSIVAPRVVDQDAAHRLGRHGEEVGAVLPVHALVIDQPHVGFVDQRRRLQAVAGALAVSCTARQAAELVVHDRGQLGERALVPVAPRTEKRADLARTVSPLPPSMHRAASRIIRFSISSSDSSAGFYAYFNRRSLGRRKEQQICGKIWGLVVSGVWCLRNRDARGAPPPPPPPPGGGNAARSSGPFRRPFR